MRKISFLLMFATVLMVVPSAFAQSSTFYLQNTACPLNSTYVGSTTVVWSSSGEPNNVGVFVSSFPPHSDIGDISLQAAATSGSSYSPWLEYGYGYRWYLVAGLDSSDDLPTQIGGSASGTVINGQEIQC